MSGLRQHLGAKFCGHPAARHPGGAEEDKQKGQKEAEGEPGEEQAHPPPQPLCLGQGEGQILLDVWQGRHRLETFK